MTCSAVASPSATTAAPWVSGNGADSGTTRDIGAVFIFERVDNTWKQTARLVASNAVSEDDFGNAVAISEDGNTVVAPTCRAVALTVLAPSTYSSV